MKKLTLLFLFLLILFPMLSAVEFTMNDEFRRGETLFAKVSGSFIEPPLAENIFFYRGHVRVSITPYIGKINDNYYIYASLPETANNYSILLSRMEYMDGSLLSDENISKNFTITNSTADFSVSPGFVISDRNFYIEVQNLQSSAMEIKITSTTQSGDSENFLFNDSISLKSGETKKINFELGEISEPTIKTIKLSSSSSTESSSFWSSDEVSITGTNYEIPVNIFEINKQAKAEEKKEEGSINLDEVETNDSEEEYVPATTATCAMLNGIICAATQTCDGTIENARDAPCCLSKCHEKTESSTLQIIGWIIVIIIVGFLVWFFKFKYRGAKTEINLLNIGMRKKSN